MARRSASILICCAVLLITAGQVFADDTVKLEHKFAQGEILRYQVSGDITAGLVPDGPNAVPAQTTSAKLTGAIQRQVKRVLPNGEAEVVYTFDSFKVNMGSGDQDLPQINQIPPMTVLMTKSGLVKSIQRTQNTGDPLGHLTFMNPTNFGQLSISLPAAALKAGDTWALESVFPSVSSTKSVGKLKIQGKLVSTNSQIGDCSVAVFDEKEDGNVAFSIPLPQSAPGQSGSAKAIQAANAWQANDRYYFAPDSGHLVRIDGTSNTRMTINMPSADGVPGKPANIQIAMKYQVSLLPNAAK